MFMELLTTQQALRSISAVVQNNYGVFMGALAMQSPCGISIIAKEL